jgi:hypothetical protein
MFSLSIQSSSDSVSDCTPAMSTRTSATNQKQEAYIQCHVHVSDICTVYLSTASMERLAAGLYLLCHSHLCVSIHQSLRARMRPTFCARLRNQRQCSKQVPVYRSRLPLQVLISPQTVVQARTENRVRCSCLGLSLEIVLRTRQLGSYSIIVCA